LRLNSLTGACCVSTTSHTNFTARIITSALWFLQLLVEQRAGSLSIRYRQSTGTPPDHRGIIVKLRRKMKKPGKPGFI
jgi:hypothetical protein